MFKKLQESSLYWRYRFITRRWLALKRWWRGLRAPRPFAAGGIRYRGRAAATPYARARVGLNLPRGITYVLVLAAVLTALQAATTTAGGFSFGLLFLVVVVGITYLFARFW